LRRKIDAHAFDEFVEMKFSLLDRLERVGSVISKRVAEMFKQILALSFCPMDL
jgi:hypothetical protein